MKLFRMILIDQMFNYCFMNMFFMLNEHVPSILEHVTTRQVTSQKVDDIYDLLWLPMGLNSPTESEFHFSYFIFQRYPSKI